MSNNYSSTQIAGTLAMRIAELNFLMPFGDDFVLLGAPHVTNYGQQYAIADRVAKTQRTCNGCSPSDDAHNTSPKRKRVNIRHLDDSLP